jgi:hypothetical protein
MRKNIDGGQALFERFACSAFERRDDCLVKISTISAKLSYRDEQARIAKRRAFHFARVQGQMPMAKRPGSRRQLSGKTRHKTIASRRR